MKAQFGLELKRFLTVGASSSVLTLGLIYGAKWLGLGDGLANALGYALGMVYNFAFNRRWTFAHTGSALAAWWRFVLVAGLAYALNLLTVLGLIHGAGWNSYLAHAAGVPVYSLTAYALGRSFVFGRSSVPPKIGG